MMTRFHLLPSPLRLLLATLLLVLPGVASAQFKGELIQRPVTGPVYRAATAIYSEGVAFQNPLHLSSYRGAGGGMLARSPRGPITERDLFVFLAVQGHATPHLYELYQKESSPVKRAELRRELERVVAVYALTRELAAGYTRPLGPQEQRRAEVLALAGWELAWTDAVLEKEATLAPGDAFHLYRTEPYEFYRPAERVARVIVKRINPPAPPDAEELRGLDVEQRFAEITDWQLRLAAEHDAAEQFLASVREEIVAGRLTFEEAARRFSEAPSRDAGGLLPALRGGELSPQLEARLLTLAPGEVSPVVRLAEGVALIQLVSERPEGYAPFEDSRSRAEELASRRAVIFLQDRALRDVSPWTVLADARAIDQLAWDDIVVEGDGLVLDKAAFLAIYPELESTETLALQEANADLVANLVGARLYIRGLARAAGAGSHAFVREGAAAAEMIVRAEGALRGRLRPLAEKAAAGAAEFHTARPELFTPARRYDAMVFTVAFPDRSSRERGEQLALEVLEDFVARARRLQQAEEAELLRADADADAEGEVAPATEPAATEPRDAAAAGAPPTYRFDREAMPTKITNLLADYRFPDLYIQLARPGFAFGAAYAPHHQLLRGLEPGGWSPIVAFEDRLAVACLLEVEELEAEPFEDLRAYAADEGTIEQKTVLLAALLEGTEAGLAFEF